MLSFSGVISSPTLINVYESFACFCSLAKYLLLCLFLHKSFFLLDREVLQMRLNANCLFRITFIS